MHWLPFTHGFMRQYRLAALAAMFCHLPWYMRKPPILHSTAGVTKAQHHDHDSRVRSAPSPSPYFGETSRLTRDSREREGAKVTGAPNNTFQCLPAADFGESLNHCSFLSQVSGHIALKVIGDRRQPGSDVSHYGGEMKNLQLWLKLRDY